MLLPPVANANPARTDWYSDTTRATRFVITNKTKPTTELNSPTAAAKEKSPFSSPTLYT